MIWGLWDQQVESIIDVKLVNADADSYKYESMVELLDWWETTKKDKHGKNCNGQRNIFTVCSFSGWNAREVIPGSNHIIDSNHGREKGQNTFAHTGVDKRPNCNGGR